MEPGQKKSPHLDMQFDQAKYLCLDSPKKQVRVLEALST